MSTETLKDLLLEEIKDLYDAEKQLVKALPEMAEAAANPELAAGFQQHLQETKGHVVRLEQVFQFLGAPAKGKTCAAMKGLIKEGNQGIKDHEAGAVRDALLIGAAQRVEHYEIAAYGTARAFAQELGQDEVALILQATLDEEGATNKKLTAIASKVNADARAAA
jgi:ferritin-like metal-binding protein YciE